MKMQSSTVQLLKLAEKYRKDNPDTPENGYVNINNNKAYGWSLSLEGRAHTFMPGTWAIDSLGNKWLAIGGNDYDGAEEWQMIPHDSFSHES